MYTVLTPKGTQGYGVKINSSFLPCPIIAQSPFPEAATGNSFFWIFPEIFCALTIINMGLVFLRHFSLDSLCPPYIFLCPFCFHLTIYLRGHSSSEDTETPHCFYWLHHFTWSVNTIIYSTTDGHLHCFYYLPGMNTPATNSLGNMVF